MNEQRTTLRDDLVAAKALIDTPEKWIKGTFASKGCWCAMGAVISVVCDDGRYAFEREVAAVRALAEEVPDRFGRNVPFYNDAKTTTHADIMALFDRAIAATSVQS